MSGRLGHFPGDGLVVLALHFPVEDVEVVFLENLQEVLHLEAVEEGAEAVLGEAGLHTPEGDQFSTRVGRDSSVKGSVRYSRTASKRSLLGTPVFLS